MGAEPSSPLLSMLWRRGLWSAASGGWREQVTALAAHSWQGTTLCALCPSPPGTSPAHPHPPAWSAPPLQAQAMLEGGRRGRGCAPAGAEGSMKVPPWWLRDTMQRSIWGTQWEGLVGFRDLICGEAGVWVGLWEGSWGARVWDLWGSRPGAFTVRGWEWTWWDERGAWGIAWWGGG